jgi:hypothetical protein
VESDFQNLIAELSDVTNDCVSLIGKEQITEIEALRTQIESLQRQLREQDDHIGLLEQSQTQMTISIQRAQQMIQSIMTQVNPSAPPIPESNLSLKIESLSNLIKSRERSSTKRLVRMVYGHVDFLTRLSGSRDLQSLFLGSSAIGTTLLSESTKELLLEQAAQTADFGTRDDQDLPSFADVLDLRVDADRRIEVISSLTERSDLGQHELSCVLLQEIVLTNTLRRYAQQMQEDLRESREAFRAVAKLLGYQEGDVSPAMVAKRLSLKLVQAKQTQCGSDWTEWGQNFYEALTGIDPGRVPLADIQIAIEESALTSVGNPPAQTLVHRSQRRTRRL